MKYLLPHRYKKMGAILAPSGFLLCVLMQQGYVQRLLIAVFGQPGAGLTGPPYHAANVAAAVTGFFGFLAGLYFLAFSKEKVEDEMVQRTRLDSFQFAALIQILTTIAGFLYILFAGDPGPEGMMLFFVALAFLFWLCFITRFNYILHVKYGQ